MLFRLYMDEDSQSRALALTLEVMGLEVYASGPLGMDGTSDEEELRFASGRGLVIYTSNGRHFNALNRAWLARGSRHSGILVRTRQRYSIGEQARRIHRIWETLSAEEMVNRYESLSQWGDESGPPP